MRGRLVDTAFQIQDSLRLELRDKLLRYCLAEKSETPSREFSFSLRDAKPLAFASLTRDTLLPKLMNGEINV